MDDEARTFQIYAVLMMALLAFTTLIPTYTAIDKSSVLFVGALLISGTLSGIFLLTDKKWRSDVTMLNQLYQRGVALMFLTIILAFLSAWLDYTGVIKLGESPVLINKLLFLLVILLLLVILAINSWLFYRAMGNGAQRLRTFLKERGLYSKIKEFLEAIAKPFMFVGTAVVLILGYIGDPSHFFTTGIHSGIFVFMLGVLFDMLSAH